MVRRRHVLYATQESLVIIITMDANHATIEFAWIAIEIDETLITITNDTTEDWNR